MAWQCPWKAVQKQICLMCTSFLIYLTHVQYCTDQDNMFLNTYNTEEIVGLYMMAWQCPCEAVHKQICLTCTSFLMIWALQIVINNTEEVVPVPSNTAWVC